MDVHDVIDSCVEPADFECDYQGHKKLPGAPACCTLQVLPFKSIYRAVLVHIVRSD
jgi:hypothetical protein